MSTGRRKLLLADDSPTIRKVISLTFADEGMEIVTAPDGREALRLLEDGRPPDIVLADAVMPGPDGYELCERVKRDERLRHVPVVLLVGAFEPFNEAEARRVGADTVLTKPFQSIRDLVNKVGSLLGGEGKQEGDERGPEADAQPGHRELAEEVLTRRGAGPAEAASRDEAGHGGDPAHGRGADASEPFADLGADDEMIEATPADSFAAAPPPAGDSFLDLGEPAAGGYEPHGAGGVAASDVHMAPDGDEYVAVPFGEDAGHARPFGGERHESPQASFSMAGAEEEVLPMEVSRPAEVARPVEAARPSEMARPAEVARPAFAAQAAGAAAADDALLDLGQIEPPSAHASAADEFVLDLDDDFDAPPAAASRAAAAGSAGPLFFEDLDDAPADAAGAFAEAAHGGTARARGDSFELLDDLLEPSGPAASGPSGPASPEVEAARTPFEFSALPSEADDAVIAREVVAQDVPPSFETPGAAPRGADEMTAGGLATSYSGGRQAEISAHAGGGVSASPSGRVKDFIEPQVVPADEPVPGTVEAAFTDGSVEGDVPKPPGFLPDAPAPPKPFAPVEPSTSGFAVGEARTGADEGARAAELSPETIDAIARRVLELMSEKVVREIAWEVVPDLAELLIKRRLDEERNK